jgi:hypothetical protein
MTETKTEKRRETSCTTSASGPNSGGGAAAHTRALLARPRVVREHPSRLAELAEHRVNGVEGRVDLLPDLRAGVSGRT